MRTKYVIYFSKQKALFLRNFNQQRFNTLAATSDCSRNFNILAHIFFRPAPVRGLLVHPHCKTHRTLQGVYINCQKLKSLLRGKYQLNIVHFGNFVLHMSSHLSTTCKIPPTMKKSLNITSWINGWFSAWTQNGDFSEWKKKHYLTQISVSTCF